MGENLRVLVIFRMHAAGKKKRGRGGNTERTKASEQ